MFRSVLHAKTYRRQPTGRKTAQLRRLLQPHTFACTARHDLTEPPPLAPTVSKAEIRCNPNLNRRRRAAQHWKVCGSTEMHVLSDKEIFMLQGRREWSYRVGRLDVQVIYVLLRKIYYAKDNLRHDQLCRRSARCRRHLSCRIHKCTCSCTMQVPVALPTPRLLKPLDGTADTRSVAQNDAGGAAGLDHDVRGIDRAARKARCLPHDQHAALW